MDFKSVDLHPKLLRGIADMGFTKPTPIQRDAIPPALEGRDLLACAMTGSGKTAAFLLPILQRLMGQKRGTTRALVLTPTRELAAQIVEHFEALARHTPLRAAAVYGGVGMQPQERAFRQGVDLIVACPGRLLDHFSRDYAQLRGLEVLVLDEADRMLDMGFLPDIRRVLRHIPEVSQTLLFSATMPRPIADLSRDLLHHPVRLNVERQSAPATGITQSIYPIAQNLKSKLLLELLVRGELHDDVLVFTRTKHRADRLSKFLTKKGIESDRIHGNRSQNQRTKALANFKSGAVQVLVATDIAARGIDVEALSHVVNFDVPHMPEDYIHRVGRTARARATGEALTFVSPEERTDLRSIERAIGKRLPVRELEGFDPNAEQGEELEIPLKERIAAIRARKAEDRARSRAKAERKTQDGRGRDQGGKGRGASGRGGSGQGGNGSRPSKPRRQAEQHPAEGREGDARPRRRRRRRGRGRGGEGAAATNQDSSGPRSSAPRSSGSRPSKPSAEPRSTGETPRRKRATGSWRRR